MKILLGSTGEDRATTINRRRSIGDDQPAKIDRRRSTDEDLLKDLSDVNKPLWIVRYQLFSLQNQPGSHQTGP